MIGEDFRKKREQDGRETFLGSVATALSAGFITVLVYRMGRRIMDSRVLPLKLLGFLLYVPVFYLVQAAFGNSVQAYARIGKRFTVVHHGCIFVVAERIGDDFTVSPGVTVGNVRGSKRLPIIGDNVFIEPGAKVLGEITVGNNVVIRANSLVLNDVPDNSIAVGNPARIMPMPQEKAAQANAG